MAGVVTCKKLLYAFLMVQVILSCRILHSSVSATADKEILHMVVHRLHSTTSRHHLFFRKAVVACVLKYVLICNTVTWILSLALQEPYHLH
jgi:hypothetical protein